MEVVTKVVVAHIVVLKMCVLLSLIVVGVTSPTCFNTTRGSSLFNYTCSTDRSIKSQLHDCSGEITAVNINESSYNGYNITECLPGKLCASRLDNLSDFDKFLVSYVSVQAVPVNVSHFTITVSWAWRPYDYNRSLNKLRGYELRIIKGSTTEPNTTVKCICIREPSLRSVSLGLDGAFQYNSSSSLRMNVQLSTFPVDIDWQKHEYTYYKYTNWPSICSGSSVCLPPLPSAPITSMPKPVFIDGGFKVLELSWTKPDSYVNSYYIELLSSLNNESLTFFVNGSNCVKVAGLSSVSRWSARVRGFSPCSGVAAYYSGGIDIIGCGQWSDQVAENFATTEREMSTFIPISPSQPTSPLTITLTVIIPVIVFALAIGVASATCVYYFWKHRTKSQSVLDPVPQYHISMPPLPQYYKPDVLVLYSPGSPKQERIEIERDVVAYLKLHDYKVISCNDHIEKTVMQWAEENARLACAVFIVCNKSFCVEWKMNSRTQLVNSIETIVASAVGQNKIKKYATILLRPGDDKYIPNNLYFRGMKSFLISSRASQQEKSRFISFVKLNYNMSW